MKRLTLFLLLCCAPQTWAAVAYDTPTTFNAVGNNTSWAFDHTVGAGSGRVLYVAISTRGTVVLPTAISFNGVALTQLTGAACTNTTITTEIWRLINPDSGTHSVAITLDTSDSPHVVAISASGVDQTTPEEDVDELCTDASSSSLTLTSGATGGCIDAIAVNDSMSVLAEGANQTGRFLVENDNSVDSDVSTELATTNCTMSWTWTGGAADRAHVAVALRASTAPTVFPALYYQRMMNQ